MGPINECCNPLKKAKHNHVRSNLILIQKKRNAKFKKFINLYMCKPCEKAVYKLSESELNSISIEKVVKMKESENVCVDVCEKEIVSDPEDFSDTDDAILDPNFEVDDEQKNLTCIKKINEILNDLVETPIKKRHSDQLTKKDKQSIKTVINNLIDGNITSTVDSEDPNQMFVNVIKEALSKEETRSGKIKVLTTLPADWSTKKIRREFNVSRRMVSRAKALAANSGFASEPPKKKGKKLSESTRENVVNFYLSDDISRVMPGMKDCISVVKDGQKIRVQKRLLLFNMKDLHEQYQEKFPEAKIGLTRFQKLKPPECIAAGQSGTHNVCVCKIHQNIRLKLFGLKKELKKHEISFVEKCDDLIKASVCEISTPACFLSTCRVCPGIQVIIKRLKKQLDDNNIQEIPYTQWTSTDRCDITEQVVSSNEFLKSLEKDWPNLLKHDFLAKSQAAYFNKKKESVCNGEFVVCLDFAENYTCYVQNAIQSHHWASNQVTLHPYVIYFRKDEKMQHINHVLISEKVTHDANSVHLFNTKLVEFLKKEFGAENVRKLFYFSDGAGSQYKNKYNFMNLICHRSDFGVDAEWNFFATSHGKGACDGVGGCVKRHAYQASLQRVNDKHITNARTLYEWASSFFKKISFSFCSQSDHDSNESRLAQRFADAKTVKNMRQFHNFNPVNSDNIVCKIYSEDEKVTITRITKKNVS